MTSHNPASPNSTPLLTDDDVLDRFSHLVGPANSSQMWFAFVDRNDMQLPVVLPIADMPAYMPEAECNQFATSLTFIAEGAGASSIIIVRERRGPAAMSDDERSALGTLRSAFLQQDLDVRAVLVSHTGGVRLIDPDELASP